MIWKKVDKAWQPENVGDGISGKLLATDTSTGEYESKIYVIETVEKVIAVFGCTVLDDKMKYMKLGDNIKIVYLGKKEGKKQKNYNDFDVFKG